ncbi:hypothetical protein Efla_007315 [Eimeria flavescens]
MPTRVRDGHVTGEVTVCRVRMKVDYSTRARKTECVELTFTSPGVNSTRTQCTNDFSHLDLADQLGAVGMRKYRVAERALVSEVWLPSEGGGERVVIERFSTGEMKLELACRLRMEL